MTYLDASCLVKLLRPEPFSEEVQALVHREQTVIVSVLCELEALLQLRAGFLGGLYKKGKLRAMERRLAIMRDEPPFEFRTLPATVFQTALSQHRSSGAAHCRTLDRLHLAAMAELGANRLLTHDGPQAKSARGLGFEVLMPAGE